MVFLIIGITHIDYRTIRKYNIITKKGKRTPDLTVIF